MRLRIDAAGKVVAVAVVSGDAKLAAFLETKLVGATTEARGNSATHVGILLVTIRVSAL